MEMRGLGREARGMSRARRSQEGEGGGGEARQSCGRREKASEATRSKVAGGRGGGEATRKRRRREAARSFDSNSNMVTAPDDVWEDYLKNDRATGEDARAPEDVFEDINDVHDSSSTSEPLAAPTEEFDVTPTSSRTRTITADASGNQAKKKRKVSNDVYIGDQMVAAAQIMTNEISKVTTVIRVEHDLRDSFINAMA
ncbi:hypothetical protein Syun_020647 [Stephania yunnanensis]|uniref:Uncharacterized protein n=1 Tax=Stephania yunnanensis TaxID=152371 RepID=A0AAP0IEV4_9MAGN